MGCFPSRAYQCQAQYCENKIRKGPYCGQHQCRYGNCEGFAYNSGVDHRFCGQHECSYQYCRNRISETTCKVCVEHECHYPGCNEPVATQVEQFCTKHLD